MERQELTEEQAIALYDSGWWEPLSHEERALFQMFETRLCMPFTVFHEAIEKTLGRPVWTHEFGLNLEGLRKELLGEKSPPTLQEIFDLIPPEKRILILTR